MSATSAALQAASSFDFASATRLVLGPGTIERLPEVVAGRGPGAVALIVDPAFERHDPPAGLRSALEGIAGPVEVGARVHGEPTTAIVDDLARWLDVTGPAVVVGIGGGSTLDATKAARALAGSGLPAASCLGRTVALPSPRSLLVLVPTTAGTGTEVNPFAVIHDEHRGLKLGMVSPALAADVAIVDAELTWSTPPLVTATAGVDALTHAIEAYCSLAASPVSDALALRAVGLAAASLLAAYTDGADAGARTAMAEASTLAGLAFANARLGLCHAASGPLGARLHLAHGEANGLLLPAVLRFNQPAVPERVATLDEVVGEDVATWVDHLCLALGMRRNLRGLEATSVLLDAVSQEAMLSAQVSTNPRPFTPADVRAILGEICW